MSSVGWSLRGEFIYRSKNPAFLFMLLVSMSAGNQDNELLILVFLRRPYICILGWRHAIQLQATETSPFLYFHFFFTVSVRLWYCLLWGGISYQLLNPAAFLYFSCRFSWFLDENTHKYIYCTL